MAYYSLAQASCIYTAKSYSKNPSQNSSQSTNVNPKVTSPLDYRANKKIFNSDFKMDKMSPLAANRPKKFATFKSRPVKIQPKAIRSYFTCAVV